MQLNFLEELSIFAAVVETKSFVGAGRILSLSKSTISKKISHLEQSLDTRLLNRSTRNISLTEAGEQLFYYSQRIGEQVQEAEAKLAKLQTQAVGKLKVHAPLCFGQTTLTRAMVEFANFYPELEFELDLGGNSLDLIEHAYDLAFYAGQPPISNLICRKLCDDPYRLVASPDYLQTHGPIVKTRDLRRHGGLIYLHGLQPDVWHITDPYGKPHAIQMASQFKSDNPQAICQAAIAKAGVALLPARVVAEAITYHQLVPVLSDHQFPSLEIYLLYPHRKHLAKKVRLFVDFLVKQFQQTPPMPINKQVA